MSRVTTTGLDEPSAPLEDGREASWPTHQARSAMRAAAERGSGARLGRGDIDGAEVYVLSEPLGSDDALGLTPAKLEVAHMVAAGLSNARIAELRGTAASTVARQLSEIYQRLAVRSRSELVALMLARGLV